MTLHDLLGFRFAPAPRASCPFCPGPEAGLSAPLCNVCRRDAALRGARP